MNRQQRRAKKTAAPVPAPGFHFAPDDIGACFAALAMYKHFDGLHSDSPEFAALMQAFNPLNTGTVGFQFSRQHSLTLLNALGLYYGFTSTGCAQVGVGETDLSAEQAAKAREIVYRLTTAINMPTDGLDARLAAQQDVARSVYAEMVRDAGLTPNPTA